MTIVFSPARNGSGVVVAADGSRRGFAAGTTVKDMAAMEFAANPPPPVVVNVSGLASLQQQVDGLATSVDSLQTSVSTLQTAATAAAKPVSVPP